MRVLVLLILAGVTIAMLTGENGILKRTIDAKQQTEKASEEEQRQLTIAEAIMNLNGTKYKSTYKGEEVTVPIPAGFAVSQVEGENTVEDGLVIIDEEGNEFVWIPCEYSLTENNGNSDAVIYNADDENNDNRDEEWKKYETDYNNGTWYDWQPKDIGEHSITTFSGFYVARYEAGVPEEATFYANSSNDYKYAGVEQKNNTKDIKNLAPVSKKGQQVWNYISQNNAKKVSENMIKGVDVQSYLIDSHAWNTICRLIKEKYGENEEILTESTKWGNYADNMETKYEKIKGLWGDHNDNNNTFKQATEYKTTTIPKKPNKKFIELATGICEDFKLYNIYDLAGNVTEWTTEIGNRQSRSDNKPLCNECQLGYYDGFTTNAVRRGGGFDVTGKMYPLISSNGGSTCEGSMMVGTGFRVVLYLK